MRRAPGQSLRLGVSRRGVSLLLANRWRGPAFTVLAEQDFAATDTPDAATIGAAIDSMLDEVGHAGWPLGIVLDDAHARLWQVTPPVGVARLADIEAAAAMRFQHLYGESAAGWQLAAHWDAATPFFAALPRPLLATLERTATAHNLHIVRIVPHFIDAWNRWQGALKADAWFALMHDKLLTLGVRQGRRLRAVRVLPMPPGAEHYWLTQTVMREALLLDMALPPLLQACGQVPAILRQAPAKSYHLRCALLEGDTVLALPGGAPLSLSSRLASTGKLT
ncbi:MAG: hypothetical protein V4754_08845 [Pseudomonadota bacterium]